MDDFGAPMTPREAPNLVIPFHLVEDALLHTKSPPGEISPLLSGAMRAPLPLVPPRLDHGTRLLEHMGTYFNESGNDFTLPSNLSFINIPFAPNKYWIIGKYRAKFQPD